MANFNSRFQRVWGLLSDLFTTSDRVVLGVFAGISQKFDLPVAAVRVVGLVALFVVYPIFSVGFIFAAIRVIYVPLWFVPVSCLAIYLIVSFFFDDSPDDQ